MIGPNQRKWLDALRSGDYEQGYGQLCRDNKFCCLGVACEVFEVPKQQNLSPRVAYKDDYRYTVGTAPVKVVTALGLHGMTGTIVGYSEASCYVSLASLNDSTEFTFSQIADMIEAHPDAFFKEPR